MWGSRGSGFRDSAFRIQGPYWNVRGGPCVPASDSLCFDE